MGKGKLQWGYLPVRTPATTGGNSVVLVGWDIELFSTMRVCVPLLALVTPRYVSRNLRSTSRYGVLVPTYLLAPPQLPPYVPTIQGNHARPVARTLQVHVQSFPLTFGWLVVGSCLLKLSGPSFRRIPSSTDPWTRLDLDLPWTDVGQLHLTLSVLLTIW